VRREIERVERRKSGKQGRGKVYNMREGSGG